MIAVGRGKGQVKGAGNRDRTLAKVTRVRHPKISHRPKSPTPISRTIQKRVPPALGLLIQELAPAYNPFQRIYSE
jgi:hypothetical protein